MHECSLSDPSLIEGIAALREVIWHQLFSPKEQDISGIRPRDSYNIIVVISTTGTIYTYYYYYYYCSLLLQTTMSRLHRAVCKKTLESIWQRKEKNMTVAPKKI